MLHLRQGSSLNPTNAVDGSSLPSRTHSAFFVIRSNRLSARFSPNAVGERARFLEHRGDRGRPSVFGIAFLDAVRVDPTHTAAIERKALPELLAIRA
jgi:hypothetical protein